jgi:hypothetical protein
MRLAVVLFLAAAAFGSGLIVGFVRIGSSQPAPPAIVVGGETSHRAPVSARTTKARGRSAVEQAVRQTSIAHYPPGEGGRP